MDKNKRRRELYQLNKDKINARRRELYHLNIEQRRKYHRDWRKKNPDYTKASRKHYWNNLERERKRVRDWGRNHPEYVKGKYEKNKPHILKQQLGYRRKNRDKVRQWDKNFYERHKERLLDNDHKFYQKHGDKIRQTAIINHWLRKNKPKPETCSYCKTNEPFTFLCIGEKVKQLDNYEWVCKQCHEEFVRLKPEVMISE